MLEVPPRCTVRAACTLTGTVLPALPFAQLFEAQTRHDIAWHYGIPYPRLHHQKPFKYREPPVLGFPGRGDRQQ